MRIKAKIFWLVSALSLLALVSPFVSAVLAEDTTVDDVGKELICMCGCGSVLINCVHIECSVRESMLATIRSQLSQGKSKGEIVQYFVRQYGEEVLAAPTKEGFNLTAWILPFAALAAGGGLVYWLIKTWVSRGKEESVVSEEDSKVDEKYRRRVEAELKKFGEDR